MSWPAVHPTRDIRLFVVVIFLRIKRRCRDSFAQAETRVFGTYDNYKTYVFSAVFSARPGAHRSVSHAQQLLKGKLQEVCITNYFRFRSKEPLD
jgi:hypothetical protein